MEAARGVDPRPLHSSLPYCAPVRSAPSLDPLRYGLRALDELAREQASVAPPPRVSAELFAPHPVLRASAPEGAALSLRLFSTSPDDATELVLGRAPSQRFEPPPARAAALFEAYATCVATAGDDALTLGFPLVTFSQQGSARAAPLFSVGGARARWLLGERAWALPAGARVGASMPLPTALVLEADADATYALHGGVWHSLFGLDGEALAAIGAAAPGGLGALVRAATRALDVGGEGGALDADASPESSGASGPLTRADLDALCEAAARRAAPSRAVRCFAHGLAMLPPRGDPTSGLRAELRTLCDGPAPTRGPLAVYLGAKGRAPRAAALAGRGALPPTPSQLAAARALEGTSDLVAVCGPPGCGKTALLHLVTAQAVVDCALGGLWREAPPRGVPWPLVVTSTNNAAVDQALSPFVGAPALPLGLRLGSRRTLAETTVGALAAALEALAAPGAMTLAAARAAFEERARPAREAARAHEAARRSLDARARRDEGLRERAAALRALIGRADASPGRGAPSVDVAALDEALSTLRTHAVAAGKLVQIHIDGKNPSVARACEKWARANELRAPRVEPALRALGVATPFGPLDASRPREDAAAQRAAIEAVVARLVRAREWLAVPAAREELGAIEATLAEAAEPASSASPDPALYEAALRVRDAWARAHRVELGRRLSAALAAAGEGSTPTRGKPLAHTLRGLAPLFPVVGCTLLSMRAAFPLDRDVIDRLVVDEAAQCAPVYAIPALARARRAMFTGDVAQLPPVYTLDPRVDERLARGLDAARIAPFRMAADALTSAQAAAEPHAGARVRLVEHFRSQPAIVALASRWSGYRLDVRTRPRALTEVSPRLAAAVQAIAVRGRGERAPEGVVNDAEVAHALRWVEALLWDGVAPADVAVLTPFVGQAVRLERELFQRGLLQRGGVLVSTVHRLQGGERRVVVFSVTATSRRHLRWLGARPHLLHVAASRAQDHLVILVDPEAATREPALAPILEVLAAGAP